mmetsp:Transcript_76233/g.170522  ORF Transcript_76233/g.170522 Transcript_76233/m.170522 type:complete len:240 (+) Transcript_76233:87-806(+)
MRRRATASNRGARRSGDHASGAGRRCVVLVSVGGLRLPLLYPPHRRGHASGLLLVAPPGRPRSSEPTQHGHVVGVPLGHLHALDLGVGPRRLGVCEEEGLHHLVYAGAPNSLLHWLAALGAGVGSPSPLHEARGAEVVTARHQRQAAVEHIRADAASDVLLDVARHGDVTRRGWQRVLVLLAGSTACAASIMQEKIAHLGAAPDMGRWQHQNLVAQGERDAAALADALAVHPGAIAGLV